MRRRNTKPPKEAGGSEFGVGGRNLVYIEPWETEMWRNRLSYTVVVRTATGCARCKSGSRHFWASGERERSRYPAEYDIEQDQVSRVVEVRVIRVCHCFGTQIPVLLVVGDVVA